MLEKVLPATSCAVIAFELNGKEIAIDALDVTPVLWVIRDTLNLTGTKYGCGKGLCGACTIHVNGVAVRSCQIPLSEVEGKVVTTIEGLSSRVNGELLQAWEALQVPQCGYCQPGQIMSASALLISNPTPTDEEIIAAMEGNLCRCGTYLRIRRAIRQVADAYPKQ